MRLFVSYVLYTASMNPYWFGNIIVEMDPPHDPWSLNRFQETLKKEVIREHADKANVASHVYELTVLSWQRVE